MSLNTQHPKYIKFIEQWNKLRDFYEGEDHVKEKDTLYLPPTAGMVLDGMEPNNTGRKNYDAYLARTPFPDYIKDAVELCIGIMHQKDAVIELPTALEPLRKKASIKGESLIQLLRRINVEQISPGRCGLLLDLPPIADTTTLPYISLYLTESIVNWDESNDFNNTDQVNLIVLDETGFRRQNNSMDWKIITQYRVLILDPVTGVYKQGVFDDTTTLSFVEELTSSPMFRGKTLNEIPFVFVNSKDLLPDPGNAPLNGLANLTWSIYKSEADFRYSLHMQGQDTLVIIGSVRNPNSDPLGEDAIRTGAGSRIDVEVTGDAKYIGVSSKGLAAQESAIEKDRKRAEVLVGTAIGDKANVESGEALKVRIGAQTASKNQIAVTGAAALEKILKMAATWVGANPDEVKVIPNLDFADIDFKGQEIVNIMTARGQGAPISLESLHEQFVERGLTKMEFEAEMQKILDENKKYDIPSPGDVVKVPAQPNQNPSTQKSKPKTTKTDNKPQK